MTNITLHKVDSATNSHINSVHSLYHRSFPKEEQRPWESLTSLIDSKMPFFSLYVATDDSDKFIGFATVWKLPNAMYIEHLAVDEPCRSTGVGGAIIDQIRDMAGEMPLVVEVELPETSNDAPRRIAFYERHGFTSMPEYDYFQPPYAPGLPDVQLMLMTTKTLTDTNEFVIMLHTLVYNQ